MRDRALVLLLAACAIGCDGRESGAPPLLAPSGTLSPQVGAYLEQLVGLMQADSINRKIIDWSRFRAEVFAAAGAAQTVPDAHEAIRLRRDRPRVAVLTANAVASSGEAVVVAFRERPNTRSFDVATCGLSTANRGFPLSDGATLNLTVSVMADRTTTRYGDSIVPDEPAGDAEVASRAIAWILGT